MEACRGSPLLEAWAGLLARAEAGACHLLELSDQCTPLAAAWCSPAAWALLAAVLLAAAAALVAAGWRLAQHLSFGDGGRMVAVAVAALKELRKAQPQQHPAQRHTFASVPAGATSSDPLAPLLCAVCLGGVSTAAGSLAPALQCCGACGLLCHDGCARKAGKTCRPLCLACPQLPHFWQAHGTVLDVEGGGGGGDGGAPLCLYCGEPAESDGLVAAEPLWSCTHCAALCHVQCFCEAHPQLPGVGERLRQLLRDGGAESALPTPAQQGRHAAAASVSPSSSSDGQADGQPPEPAPLPAGEPAAAAGAPDAGKAGGELRRRHGSTGGGGSSSVPPPPPGGPAPLARPRGTSWLRVLVGGGGGGGGAGAGGTSSAASESGYSSDNESDDPYDARLERQRWQRRRRRRLRSRDIAALDVCTLGPNRRSVLPPIAVRPALRSAGGSLAEADAEAQQQRGEAADGGHAAAAAGAGDGGVQPPSPQQQPQQRASSEAKRGSPPRASAGSSKRKGGSWWRRLYRPRRLQWEDYRVEDLPAGCKPVLVFLNTKSGPQAGAALRRRFLRALHPLQVVELPRQQPGPALQLFAGVAAHIRILVIGGDGSVSWVLSCLDELRAARAAAGEPDWKPPPVAMLPLGTGNDLARVLGWGGGHGAWQLEGVGAMLSEVQHAAPLQLDRWDLALAPPAPLPEPPVTPRGKLASMLHRGQSLALGSLGVHPSHGGGGGGGEGGGGAGTTIKVLNNYLGVGIDARIALEFHHMRDRWPSLFFTSQLGNKFWYTVVGGVDIMQGHAMSNLDQKLQVLCDGRPVALPPGMEGLLVLNISSFMGGVDLWRNSYCLEGAGVVGERPGGGRRAPQSMQDGRLELLAVYGSLHLGQLQVGLSRAVRLGQGRDIRITTLTALPMQVDGEPWVQAPAAVALRRRAQHGLVLRRVRSKPLARMMQAVGEVLEDAEQRGTLSTQQAAALRSELAARLQPMLAHPAA